MGEEYRHVERDVETGDSNRQPYTGSTRFWVNHGVCMDLMSRVVPVEIENGRHILMDVVSIVREHAEHSQNHLGDAAREFFHLRCEEVFARDVLVTFVIELYK